MTTSLARLVFPEKMKELSVEVEVVAEMAVHNPFDFFLEPYANQFPFRYEAGLEQELTPFLGVRPAGPQVRPTVGKETTSGASMQPG